MRPAVRYALTNAQGARLAARPATRPVVAQARLGSRIQTQTVQSRFYSNGGGADPQPGSNYIVLAAIGALGLGGYWYLKPIRDVAQKLNALGETATDAANKAKDMASQAADTGAKVAKQGAQAAGVESTDDVIGLAKKYLPSAAAAIAGGGGVGGLLSNLKDADLESALDSLKKYGGEDVKKVVDKIQAKVKEAGGEASKIDWKGLANDLNKEFGGKYKSVIDNLIGKIPSVEDFDELVAKAKDIGKDKLKELEKSANDIYKSMEKAAKDKKDVGDAFVEGVKDAAPGDVEKLIKELKETAKSVGIPADQIESWLQDQAGDAAKDAAKWAETFQQHLDTAAKWLPGEPQFIVDKVSEVSPSLGKILDSLLKEAQDKVEKGKDAVDKGKKEAEKVAKK